MDNASADPPAGIFCINFSGHHAKIAKSDMAKILLIDDDAELRDIYARYLTADGFQVLRAESGERALKDFPGEDPAIILLDIRLPAQGGSALMPQLKKAYPQAKIIVSSCYDLAFQKETITNADAYFNKLDGCKALIAKLKPFLQEGHDFPAGVKKIS